MAAPSSSSSSSSPSSSTKATTADASASSSTNDNATTSSSSSSSSKVVLIKSLSSPPADARLLLAQKGRSSSSSRYHHHHHHHHHPKNHRPLLPRTLQGLLAIYVLSGISVFVVRYNVTFLDTIGFARDYVVDTMTTTANNHDHDDEDNDWTILMPHLWDRVLPVQSSAASSSSSSSSPSTTTTRSSHRQYYRPPSSSSSSSSLVGATLTTTTDSSSSSTPANVVFVHVGKTGGRSISSMLRVYCESRTKNEASRQHCFEEWKQRHRRTTTSHNSPEDERRQPELEEAEETQLSQVTRGFLHVASVYPSDNDKSDEDHDDDDDHGSILKNATHFLVSTRNPIERVTSWFYFLHPQNCHQDPVTGEPTPRHLFELIDKACITKNNIRRYEKQRQQGPPIKNNVNNRRQRTSFRSLRRTSPMEHVFYQECFPTITDFALSLAFISRQQQQQQHSQENYEKFNQRCHTLARRTLQGNGGPNGMAGHLWANYTYYQSRTMRRYPNTPVWVVRTRYIWHDLLTIERHFLGGNGVALQWQQERQQQASTKLKQQQQQNEPQSSRSRSTTTTRHLANDNNNNNNNDIIIHHNIDNSHNNNSTHATEYHKDFLSPQGYSILCCALQQELKVYQDILQAAINLQPQEKERAILEVLQKCGAGASITLSSTTTSTADTPSKMTSLDDLQQFCVKTYPMTIGIS